EPRRFEESLIKGHYCFHQDNDDSKCEVAHTSLPIRSSKSPARYRSREGYMAPKPKPAGLASVFGTLTSVFGIVLAVAAILAIMAWSHRNLAEPIPSEAIYQSQYLNLY